MADDDWDGWKALTNALGQNKPTCGRRKLFVTNPGGLARGRQGHRQRDSDSSESERQLTEKLEAMKMAAEAGYIGDSHRSGETEARLSRICPSP